MKVKAATGLKVPMEGKPMAYIDDINVVEVPDDSAYYARRISDGDLVEVVKQDNKKGNA